MFNPNRQKMEEHYDDLKKKVYFESFLKYMTSGPIVAMVLEGPNAILTAEKLKGVTEPDD